MTGVSKVEIINRKGWVFWITGLSASGKTTVATLLFNRLRDSHSNSILLDGDELRQVINPESGFSVEDRLKLANKYSRLCRLISNQDIHVVISTISMFNECRQWNRANIEKYCEVYLKVPFHIRVKRDQKGLYQTSPGLQIVGVDIDCEEPVNPDILILDNGSMNPAQIADKIWDKFPTELEL